MNNKIGYIYFIYDSSNDCIKIGFTANEDLNYRLSSLQTGNPRRLILLGHIHGTIEQEKELHKEYANLKTCGGSEWFYCSDVLAIKIKELLGGTEAASINPIVNIIPSNGCFISKTRACILLPHDYELIRLKKYYLLGSGIGINAKVYFKLEEFEGIINSSMMESKTNI